MDKTAGSISIKIFILMTGIMRSVPAILIITAFSSSLPGCAGGIPSIPDSPDAILAEGKQYFERKKYFQSKELFQSFLSKFPGHDRSDEAQFYLAESLINDKEYPLASLEYRVLINNYGYSEYVDDALFKMGLCSYKQAPRADLDQSKTEEALSSFRQFLRTFPKSPLAGEVEKYIGKIYRRLAEKGFSNGRYYYKRRRWEAALIYFDKVIENYPGNEFWIRSLFLKGKILLARGDKEGAMKSFDKILDYPGEIDIKNEAEEMVKNLREQ